MRGVVENLVRLVGGTDSTAGVSATSAATIAAATDVQTIARKRSAAPTFAAKTQHTGRDSIPLESAAAGKNDFSEFSKAA